MNVDDANEDSNQTNNVDGGTGVITPTIQIKRESLAAIKMKAEVKQKQTTKRKEVVKP